MLLLIVAVIFCVLMFSRSLRLEGATDGRISEVQARIEQRKPDVRAYVDGKPVKSYLME